MELQRFAAELRRAGLKAADEARAPAAPAQTKASFFMLKLHPHEGKQATGV